MSSSLVIGLECRHCNKRPMDLIMRHKKTSSEQLRNLGLILTDRAVCLRCGGQLGEIEELKLQANIGDVIAALVQHCMFRIESFCDKTDLPFEGLHTFNLVNGADAGLTCQVTAKQAQFGEGEQADTRVFNYGAFEGSMFPTRPPIVLEQTVRTVMAVGPWHVDPVIQSAEHCTVSVVSVYQASSLQSRVASEPGMADAVDGQSAKQLFVELRVTVKWIAPEPSRRGFGFTKC